MDKLVHIDDYVRWLRLLHDAQASGRNNMTRRILLPMQSSPARWRKRYAAPRCCCPRAAAETGGRGARCCWKAKACPQDDVCRLSFPVFLLQDALAICWASNV